jgi:hypothetical protein
LRFEANNLKFEKKKSDCERRELTQEPSGGLGTGTRICITAILNPFYNAAICGKLQTLFTYPMK